MKHSVYERDKLSNKEQIESAVSGNIKADLSPNRECCGDTAHQATHVLAGLNTKHRLEQNVPCKLWPEYYNILRARRTHSSNMVI